MKTKNKFILCECGCEGILITKFENDYEKEIYLAIFSYGTFNKKQSFINRIKYCWYHLTTGKKYDDQIILSYDKAKELSNILLGYTEKESELNK